MKKAPMIDRIRSRIEQKRRAGATAADIGKYARQNIGQFNLPVENLGLTEEELRTTRPTFPEMVAKERKAAKASALHAARAQNRSATDFPKKSSLRGGLGPTAVIAALGCTKTELNRWSSDGRLPPDGEKFYHGVGPRGGARWGRAWLPEKIETAKNRVEEWRRIDSTKKKFRRSGLKVVDGHR